MLLLQQADKVDVGVHGRVVVGRAALVVALIDCCCRSLHGTLFEFFQEAQTKKYVIRKMAQRHKNEFLLVAGQLLEDGACDVEVRELGGQVQRRLVLGRLRRLQTGRVLLD